MKQKNSGPDNVEGVGDLVAAEPSEHGVFELVALVAGAPHIDGGNNEVSLTGKISVPSDGPFRSHCLRTWTSITKRNGNIIEVN